MLAARPIVVTIGGGTVRLRSTLRAAMRLEREFGFQNLHRLLLQGSITATCAILAENADPVPTVTVWDAIRLTPDLIAYVEQLVGKDEANDAPKANTAPSVTYAELFAQLFRLGTGVLGWTPADTWAASPAEIVAAYAGRVELIDQVLISIFGKGDASTDDASTPNFKADTDRAAKLKALA